MSLHDFCQCLQGRMARNGSGREHQLHCWGEKGFVFSLKTCKKILPSLLLRSRPPRRGRQAHSSFLKWILFLSPFACICMAFRVFATYRHTCFKIMFWDASVTSSRKMQINVDFWYYQLHQSKRAEARTLLEFDKSVYLNDFPRGLGKNTSCSFPIAEELQLFLMELHAYATCQPHPQAAL